MKAAKIVAFVVGGIVLLVLLVGAIALVPGVQTWAVRKAVADQPGLKLEVRDGYFDMDDVDQNARVLAQINAFRPDVLFVGMGMPRQELWIERNFAEVASGVMFSVGGAFDYEAGVVPTPPRWSGRWGLEWLFRFAAEPRRLFSRYFVEPWFLLPPALAEAWDVVSGRG